MSSYPHRLRIGPVCCRLLAIVAVCGTIAACSGAVESGPLVSDKSGVVTGSPASSEAETEGVVQRSASPGAGDEQGGAQSTVVGKEATFEWQPSPDGVVAGYRVYYGAQSRTYFQAKGSGLDAGRSTDYTISGLEPGSVVYVAVTAYDLVGNESDYSAELSWIVQ